MCTSETVLQYLIHPSQALASASWVPQSQRHRWDPSHRSAVSDLKSCPLEFRIKPSSQTGDLEDRAGFLSNCAATRSQLFSHHLHFSVRVSSPPSLPGAWPYPSSLTEESCHQLILNYWKVWYRLINEFRHGIGFMESGSPLFSQCLAQGWAHRRDSITTC